MVEEALDEQDSATQVKIPSNVAHKSTDYKCILCRLTKVLLPESAQPFPVSVCCRLSQAHPIPTARPLRLVFCVFQPADQRQVLLQWHLSNVAVNGENVGFAGHSCVGRKTGSQHSYPVQR